MMGKEGQLYLLAAMLIGLVLFILVSPSNVVKETVVESRFEETSRNFEVESARFINYAIGHDEDVAENFLNFTILFTSYSKTKNPDFELMYAFVYDGVLYMGNYLGQSVDFTFEGSKYAVNGCFADVKTGISIAGLNIGIPGVDIGSFARCQGTAVVGGGPPYVVDIGIVEGGVPVLFTVEVSAGSPEVIILAREERGETRKVFAKGRFI